MENATALTPSVGSTAVATRDDRAWAMKRDWTDQEFQQGAEANRAKLQEFEDVLVSRLRESCARELGADAAVAAAACGESDAGVMRVTDQNVLSRVLAPITVSHRDPPERVRAAVLRDPEVLGSSLDIVGAYLKNYEVDKAGAVIETVLPVCRERGGLWLLKALNHLSTVRMKQARPSEALAALKEVEAYASSSLSPEEMDEAWEFWETVYRNFGWVLSSLSRHEEALSYIQRAIDVKERVGKPASWFDLWDLGRMKAVEALKASGSKEIRAAQAVVTQALWRHRDEEPSDLVMRAKIWHSVGECSFALGHLAEAPSGKLSEVQNPNAKATSSEAQAHYKKALKCFKEAHKLFKSTEGQYNPLTGQEAQAVSWTLLKLGSAQDAKPFLLDALETSSRQQSGWGPKDAANTASLGGPGSPDSKAPALMAAMQTVDRILDAHRTTEDRDGLTRYFAAIERLCANVSRRLRIQKDTNIDSAIYEKLVSSCSMVMVASGTEEGMAKSQELLRTFLWDGPNTEQAQICTQMLKALPGGEGPDFSAPGMSAFMNALVAQAGQDEPS